MYGVGVHGEGISRLERSQRGKGRVERSYREKGKGERSWREEKRLERSEHQGLVCKAGQKRRESLCEGNSPGQPVQTVLPLI